MAKRKRLSPVIHPTAAAEPGGPPGLDRTETASGRAAPSPPRAPIAHMAGDAATHAALTELTAEVESARRQGRFVQALPLDEIRADHLFRDRMTEDAGEMAALKASLSARGQQTPIEVVALPEGGYGLISGFRRLKACGELLEETGEARFGVIQALIKPIDTASDAYVAMVEENEIRSDLSFYERARLAAEAARLGVYPTASRAIQALFANASAAKRSKINSFVRIHESLGDALVHPAAIPERLGLALSAALEADPQVSRRLRDALRKTPPADAAAERALLERALKRSSDRSAGTSRPPAAEIRPGLRFEAKAGRAVLTGPGVTADLLAELQDWLSQRG